MTFPNTRPAQNTLAEACSIWQSGRDGGSSRLRGAARVVTGVPHYFDADFIRAHEEAARRDPASLRHARAILDAVADSAHRTASEWCTFVGATDTAFAGRGLAAKPPYDRDIEERLDDGTLDMPLWGVSLDREVTVHYGGRFLLEVVDAFPAVPAWLSSAVKAEEQELIAGGSYRVVGVDRRSGFTHATLQWSSATWPIPTS